MKIGFISMPLAGHLNPMTTLARKLKSRGHDVVFVGVLDAGPIVRDAGLDFLPFCEEEYPEGAVSKGYGALADLQGLDVAEFSIREMHPNRLQAALKHLPGVIESAGIQALIIDTIHFYVELIPLRLGIPYIHVWNILHIDLSGESPASFFNWTFEDTTEARTRYSEGARKMMKILSPVREVAQAYASEHHLQIDWSDPYATLSKLAVITQTPREFDFPIKLQLPQFRYAGPFHDDEGKQAVSFPWKKLTGKPLIYASMGTLVNGAEHVYRTILRVASRLDGIQMVLSVGKNIDLEELEPIPSNVIAVPRAPQIELLEKAALCITHAGANTALESLARGVPMVAIPVGFDQPGVAVRIAYHGVGEFVDVKDLTEDTLGPLVQAVMSDSRYRDNARRFQHLIAAAHGLDVAATIIESAFQIVPRFEV